MMEYVLVLGVVLMVLFAMNPMIKRGSQSMIKLMADQIGNQVNGEQSFDETGHMDHSLSASMTRSETKMTEGGGQVGYVYGDQSGTGTRVSLNLGFTSTNY